MKFKLIFLLLAVFMLCSNTIQAAVWLYPTGATIYVNNITYTTSQGINFTYLKVTDNYVTFNFISFILTSANPISVEIEQISNSSTIKGRPLVQFNVTTTSPIVAFDLGGFKNSSDYELHIDNQFHSFVHTSTTGNITFSYSDFSKHTFAIFGLRNYTFQVRYENYSQGLVNLSRWGPHQFIVQYDNAREENWINDRIFTHNETNFSMYDFYNGSFNISVDRIPLWFELHWNDTGDTNIDNSLQFKGYDERTQNLTTTYLQIDHTPISYASINVTCINESSGVHSYPIFGWSGTVISIYPYTAAGFSRVFVNYTYTRSNEIRCNRIQVADYAQRNMTFYIFTNKRVYGETTSYFNNSLVRYTYDFEDKTGIFITRPDVDTYATIYTYTPNGTQMIIHSEYWDATDKMYPWLLFEKEYFIGVHCTQLSIDRVGVAPSSTNTNPVIIIDYPTTSFYSLGDIFLCRSGWMVPPTGCYVNYIDTVTGVRNVVFYLYNFSNSSLAHQSSSALFVHNFTYPTACQHNTYYWIMIINHTYWDTNQTLSGIIYPAGVNKTVDASFLNTIFNLTFGETPFRNLETGQEVPWVYVGIFAVFFLLLVSFAIINAYGAVALSGTWLMFSGAYFNNLPEVGLLGAAALITSGAFLLILAILAALGGYGQK